MEAQLDFTWQPDHVIWKPHTVIHTEPQRFEMPEQLNFKLAELPSIPSEQPAPLSFTNNPSKKLIQFTGIPNKTSTKSAKKAPQKPKAPAAKKAFKPPEESKSKPEWNSKVSTTGLFDIEISKKVPIELKHAIRKENSARPKKPETFNDFSDLPIKNKPNSAKRNTERPGKTPEVLDNLEIKFITDQEEIVKRLEKQLEAEKAARKKLDEQFSEALKEKERMNKKVKVATNTALFYEAKLSKNDKPVQMERAVNSQPKFQQVASTNAQILDLQRPKSSEKLRFDAKGGNIYEPPTHDLTPMVLKAGKSQVVPRHLQAKSTQPVQSKASERFTTQDIAVTDPSQKPETLISSSQRAYFSQPQERIIKPSSPSKAVQIKFETSDIPESDPILNSLSAAMVRFKAADHYSSHPSSGLISKVGSKYIAYYANELTDLLIDDFLEDCVYDLQQIEERKQKQIHQEYQKEAEKNFEIIVKDFQEEAEKVQSKYLGKPVKVNKILDSQEGPMIYIEDKKRDWEISIDNEVLERIRRYKKSFEEFQRVFAGGSEGRLWDVYGVIGDDIVNEIIGEVAEEYDAMLDEFTERMVNHEFA